ncbi:MAG: hypothetical protein HY540_04095 [Deltaproteobacteria bacterium]|nr:hypothetical protein [Deltaproteobacteria bacterium]
MNQKGMSALVLVIIMMVLVLYMGVGTGLITESSNDVSGLLQTERSLYLAEAGVNATTYRLKSNWSNWTNAALFPTQSFAGGSFEPTVTDDDDGDGNTSVDSNNKLVVTVKGIAGDAKRYVRAVVSRYHPALSSALCTTENIETSGSATINGDTCEGISSVPSIDTAAAIDQAKANTDNGYSARTDRNYFRGDFPPQKPDSLNGVIYIDTYADGSPANANLSGNIETTSADPAILVVMGNLSLSGGVSFRGLIYTSGTVSQDTSVEGSVTIEGAIISTTNVSLAGSMELTFSAAAVNNEFITSLLLNDDIPTIVQWSEYFP